MRVTRHCIERYEGPDLSDALDLLNAFTAYKGPVSALLGSADIAMLLTKSLANNVAGVAWSDTVNNPVSEQFPMENLTDVKEKAWLLALERFKTTCRWRMSNSPEKSIMICNRQNIIHK